MNERYYLYSFLLSTYWRGVDEDRNEVSFTDQIIDQYVVNRLS